VIDALLAGETVDHAGEFAAAGARLSWAPGRLPVAIAGRGPRVEQLSAQRADWALVSGKPVAEIGSLTRSLRERAAASGRQLRIAWNPMVGWEPGHADAIRAHLSYMTVDMPAAWRQRLGIGDALVAGLRGALADGGPDAAARLVPDQVLDAFAIVGDPPDVARRLADAVTAAVPELVIFGPHEYSVPHVSDIAALAGKVGLAASAGRIWL
jgi:alkanesulfonate monooxygenase SsuD/methylene tetrahydromethanopterin reductase-like flavin-dependent oxidoreductase (luciferase family)